MVAAHDIVGQDSLGLPKQTPDLLQQVESGTVPMPRVAFFRSVCHGISQKPKEGSQDPSPAQANLLDDLDAAARKCTRSTSCVARSKAEFEALWWQLASDNG